jgi:hypothetical protein
MRFKFFITLCMCLVVGGGSQSSQSAMRGSDSSAMLRSQRPPLPSPTPVEDTDRYVEWLKQRGTPISDRPHEQVSLRIRDWGFFYHGERPIGSWEPLKDRVALDRTGHAVTEAESSDWYAFLSTEGLEARDALQRIAWLFNAGALEPASDARGGRRDGVTAPTLTIKEGVIKFQGWWQAFSDPPYSRRITIVATTDRTNLVKDTGEKSGPKMSRD